jgi:hypothetical protein
MSTLDLHMRPRGLITDPSSTAAPDGALRQALDCVLRRPGIVEPRPGFREGMTT